MKTFIKVLLPGVALGVIEYYIFRTAYFGIIISIAIATSCVISAIQDNLREK